MNGLEGIKLNERSKQRKIYCLSQLKWNLKKIHKKIHKICGNQRRKWGVKKLDEGGQKVQSSSYKLSTGDVLYYMMTIVHTAMQCLCSVFKRC